MIFNCFQTFFKLFSNFPKSFKPYPTIHAILTQFTQFTRNSHTILKPWDTIICSYYLYVFLIFLIFFQSPKSFQQFQSFSIVSNPKTFPNLGHSSDAGS